MKHRQTIQTIARRLPFTTRRQVEDVLEVLTELWQDELAKCRCVTIPGIGKLSLEIQQMKRGGAMKAHGSSPAVRRVYGRFRPSAVLREKLKEKVDG